MIPQTLAIFALFLVLALSRRTGGGALGVVVMSMLFWPEFLRIPFGLAAMSVPRLVALALLLRYLSSGAHRQISYGRADKLVVLIWCWTFMASLLAGADSAHVGQMIGRGFDTLLMYFIARIAIRGPTDLRDFYKGLAWVALVMCAVGVTEAITTRSPYSGMTSYMTWSWFDKEEEYRLGLLRAKASTATHIYFGMAMMLVLGMLWALRGYAHRRHLNMLSIPAALLAALSSMSSGPWLGCIQLVLLNLFAKRVSMIRPALGLILAAAIVMEIASNRHFYNLIDYLALDPHTAWYRTRLLEVAVSQWQDYWLLGVGANWPDHWAALLDGRNHIDIVNHFVLVALYGGIPAVTMYVATHVIAVRMAVNAWHSTHDTARRNVLFGMAATLISLDLASMSVGLFGPAILLSHILLGLMISLATWPDDSQLSDGNVSARDVMRDFESTGRLPDGLVNRYR